MPGPKVRGEEAQIGSEDDQIVDPEEEAEGAD